VTESREAATIDTRPGMTIALHKHNLFSNAATSSKHLGPNPLATSNSTALHSDRTLLKSSRQATVVNVVKRVPMEEIKLKKYNYLL
jgi:hypothetical protein